MYVDALTALANDPAVGLVAFDAFPPRLPGETPWADPVLTRAIELQRSTGVAFVSLCMSPLAYIDEAKAFTKKWKQLPFLQGHRAASGAIRALLDDQQVRARAVPALPAHPNRAAALRVLRGASGPVDEATGAKLLELYGVRRPKEAVATTPEQAARAASAIPGPVAVKALAPELPHKARLGGVRLGLRGTGEVEQAASEVLAAARRAGAKAPKVLVQEMVHGDEVLIGAIVDEQFGATITIRPGGAMAEAGDATFVAAPLTAKQARAYVASQAERCGLNADEHDLRALAKAVESIARAAHDLRGRITSLEANPMLVGPRGAVAVDALAEAKPAL
jgi:acyl-CoA synthetase (NDP forming)